MGRYVSKNAMPIKHPNNPKRNLLVRAGEPFEMDDKDAAQGLEAGTLRRVDEDETDASDTDEGSAPEIPTPRATTTPSPTEPVSEVPEPGPDLPERPANSGSKEEWRAYLAKLADATAEPIDVPPNATREAMISMGDERVRKYETEGKPGQ